MSKKYLRLLLCAIKLVVILVFALYAAPCQ